MKKLLLGTFGLLALALPAAAADLRIPVKAPVIVDPVYSWTGFYIGGNVGYSWGRVRDNVVGTTTTDVFRTASGPGTPLSVITTAAFALPGQRYNVDGVIGGGQFGYNWQTGAWLLGLETDFQGSGERGRGTVCSVAGCPAGSLFATETTRLEWFGTARARAGYLVTPQLLIYGTGGAAYGNIRSTLAAGTIGGAGIIGGAIDKTRLGWTAGAGGEWAIDRNWSVKLEYLYMDLGRFGGTGGTTVTTVANVPQQGFSTQTTTTFGSNGRFTDHILRVGFNYRFGGPVVAKY